MVSYKFMLLVVCLAVWQSSNIHAKHINIPRFYDDDWLGRKLNENFRFKNDEEHDALDIIYKVKDDESNDLDGMVSKRSAILKTTLWKANPNGTFKIPYVIQQTNPRSKEKFTPLEILLIEAAISYFNLALHCKSKPWVPRTNETEYIVFRKHSRCQSYLGKKTQHPVLKGVQPILISSKCAANAGNVIHEMMHALGFLHEHRRSDRDDYITVNFNNIRSDQYNEFEKIPEEYILQKSTKYDYHSLMHYKKDAMARYPGFITIETNDPSFENDIGQRRMLSTLDRVAVNKYFNCPDVAQKKKKSVKTSNDSILRECNFENGLCSNFVLNKNSWRIVRDSRCRDRIYTCPQLKDANLCNTKPVHDEMKKYCGPSCGTCNAGHSVMLKDRPGNFLGLVYVEIPYKDLVGPSKCAFNKMIKMCVSFTYTRSIPDSDDVEPLYDSKVQVYGLNFKRVYFVAKKKYGRRFTYQTKVHSLPNDKANQWTKQEIDLDVKCANTLVVIRGLKKTDDVEIDNVVVKAGQC